MRANLNLIEGPGKREHHHAWLGNDVSERGGRTRAIRMYPIMPPCVMCGNDKAERHHIDGDTANNDPENILPICRACHMKTDGRYEAFRNMAISRISEVCEAAAEKRLSLTRCSNGHIYDEVNTRIDKHGVRHCRACSRASGKRYRRRLREAKSSTNSL